VLEGNEDCISVMKVHNLYDYPETRYKMNPLDRIVFAKNIITCNTNSSSQLLLLSHVCVGWRDTVCNYLPEIWNTFDEKTYTLKNFIISLYLEHIPLARKNLFSSDIVVAEKSEHVKWRHTPDTFIKFYTSPALCHQFLTFLGSSIGRVIPLNNGSSKWRCSEICLVMDMIKAHKNNDRIFRLLREALLFQMTETDYRWRETYFFVRDLLDIGDMELLGYLSSRYSFLPRISTAYHGNVRDLGYCIDFFMQCGCNYELLSQDYADLEDSSIPKFEEDHEEERTAYVKKLHAEYLEKYGGDKRIGKPLRTYICDQCS
jgi:hypothetical protein